MTRYRLKGSVFERESSGTLAPYRVIFLSVEGKKTEPGYFEGLNRELSRGHLPFPRCVIKVLKKEDHGSDPGSVISLLDEYLDLRYGRYDQFFPPVFLEKYNGDTIERYFQGSTSAEECAKFESFAKRCGVSARGLRGLCDPTTEQDIFGVVIDHDSRPDLPRHMERCRRRGYNVFLTTPCFELWLLMHFVDVFGFYDVQELFENRGVSKSHTFVSKELSKIANTNKRVNFDHYSDKLLDAIERSRQVGDDVYCLLKQPGSNLHLLFDIIAGKRDSMWDGVSDRVAVTRE